MLNIYPDYYWPSIPYRHWLLLYTMGYHYYLLYAIGHMTFIFKPGLAIMKVNMYATNEEGASRHSSYCVDNTPTHSRL